MLICPMLKNQKLWTPSLTTTALWLDAQDADTVILTSGFVSEWQDKSGNNNHASQSTSTRRPSYSSNGIVFDGSSDLLDTSSNSLLNTNTFSWFIVFNMDGVTTTTRVIFRLNYTSGASTNSFAYSGLFNQTNNFYSHIRDSTGTLQANLHSSNLNLSLNSTVLDSTNTFKSWLNGSNEQSLSTSSGYSTPSGHITTRIGANTTTTPSQFFLGSIHELIFVPSALNTVSRQRFEGYLAHKWNLTASLASDHPYKNSPPYA